MTKECRERRGADPALVRQSETVVKHRSRDHKFDEGQSAGARADSSRKPPMRVMEESKKDDRGRAAEEQPKSREPQRLGESKIFGPKKLFCPDEREYQQEIDKHRGHADQARQA